MKNITIVFFIGLFQFNLMAGGRNARVVADNPLNHMSEPVVAAPAAPTVHIRDPLRMLDGTNIIPVGKGWVSFQGTIKEVLPDGVLVRTSVIGLSINNRYSSEIGGDIFFVSHYPYPVVANDMIGYDTVYRLYALPAGIYTYTNNVESSYANSIEQRHSYHKLEYGIVPTTAQIAAFKKAQQDKATARAVQVNQEAADKGDAYGMLRMGERYRDGDGVPKDLAKSREYLTKASNAGSVTAQEALDKLPKE